MLCRICRCNVEYSYSFRIGQSVDQIQPSTRGTFQEQGIRVFPRLVEKCRDEQGGFSSLSHPPIGSLCNLPSISLSRSRWLGRLSLCLLKLILRVQFSPSAHTRRGFLLHKKVIGGKRESVSQQHSMKIDDCLLYTSPSPRDKRQSRMPSSA